MTRRILQLNNEWIGNHTQRSVFYALVSGLCAVFMVYSYLVGSIIFGAVERRHLDASVRELRAHIGVLEVEYLNLSGKVNLSLAHSLGFKEAAQVFTARKGDASLSLGPNEI